MYVNCVAWDETTLMGGGWVAYTGPLGAPNRLVRGPGYPRGVRYRVGPVPFHGASHRSLVRVLCLMGGWAFLRVVPSLVVPCEEVP